MKQAKGKRYFSPDRGWTIQELKSFNRNRTHNGINLLKYFINQYNRKIRRLFNKKIKEAQDD